MRVDAHQHYWSTSHRDYGWLQPVPALAAIYRDFGPADLHPLLDAAGIDATVLVQAAPSEAETARLLALAADAGSRVLGVVGWCDLLAADAAQRIAQLARNPLLRGLRPMLQDLPDPRWILQPALSPAIDTMQHHDLAFDALVKGDAQLDALCEFVQRRPGLRIVLDHGGKPPIAKRRFDAWAGAITRLAAAGNVTCKLSGLATEAAPIWQTGDLRPWVEHLLAAFGPQRLIWGSDWPVVDLAGGYDRWHAASTELLRDLDAEQQERIFGANAIDFYRLAAR